jgi:uncharacterized protein
VRQTFLLPLVLAAALAGCGAGKAANDNGNLPKLTGRVVDNADLLAAADEKRLSAQLAKLESRTGDQLVVVTLPSLEGESIEAVGLRLGNGWGIGQKELDNGVLLIVAPAERAVRIEVGLGLEALLTDVRADAIIDARLLPLFREGRHAQAIDAGVESISTLLQQDRRRPQRVPQQKAA